MLPMLFSDKFVKLTNFDTSLGFQMEDAKKSFLKTLSAYSLPFKPKNRRSEECNQVW